jgi:hypothetical protein
MELNLPDCCDVIRNCIETDGSCCHPGPSLLGDHRTEVRFTVCKVIQICQTFGRLSSAPNAAEVTNKSFEEVLRMGKVQT